MAVTILFLGDVMGRPGREVVKTALRELRKQAEAGAARYPDLVVVNGENGSGGLGLTSNSARELLQVGADVLTSGNHIWKHKEIQEYIRGEPRLLRPANYPEGAPGTGLGVFTTAGGTKVAVLNLMGRTYMEDMDCPFQAADALLARVPEDVRVRLVDFHAEATSEKIALAYYLDGRVSAVLGTHTHVQTNDARILKNGTAAVTDVGMCGPQDSILGMDAGIIVERFLTRLPNRFRLAKGAAELRGALVEIDEERGKALSVRLVSGTENF